MMDTYRDSENRLHGMMKEKLEVTEKRNEQRKEALTRLAKLKQLSSEQGTVTYMCKVRK